VALRNVSEMSVSPAAISQGSDWSQQTIQSLNSRRSEHPGKFLRRHALIVRNGLFDLVLNAIRESSSTSSSEMSAAVFGFGVSGAWWFRVAGGSMCRVVSAGWWVV
jgi:hypothetical protein